MVDTPNEQQDTARSRGNDLRTPLGGIVSERMIPFLIGAVGGVTVAGVMFQLSLSSLIVLTGLTCIGVIFLAAIGA